MILQLNPSKRVLPASGTATANGGRLAGGAPGIENPAFFSVFPNNTIPSAGRASYRPSGLIDKRQQQDPASTSGFGHPFDGSSGYRSISTQQQLPPLQVWNGFVTRTEVAPEIQPHERGTFFQPKATPVVKTQGGAANTGAKSDTSFHPQKKVVVPRAEARSTVPTEKISRRATPPSFATVNTLRFDPNNSNHGTGRWSVVKRGANET